MLDNFFKSLRNLLIFQSKIQLVEESWKIIHFAEENIIILMISFKIQTVVLFFRRFFYYDLFIQDILKKDIRTLKIE